MTQGLCDIDKQRPVAHTIRLIRNGRERLVELCDLHYAQIRRQQAQTSPFESLFELSRLKSFASELMDFSDGSGYTLPREREATDIEEYIPEHTQQLIQKAAETTLRFGRQEVDTEHLLYALADSDIVQQVLKQFKLASSDIKGYIENNTPRGEQELKTEHTEVMVSPRVKQVLESAFQVAQELGHGYIGPEHLLIALTEEDEGLAGDLLRKYGLTPQSLRQATVKVVGRGAREGRLEAKSDTPQLDKYSRNLSLLAKQGRLDPVIGRGKEIETTIEILARRTKNNPVLIGEPGVGKTAIVEGLAQRIQSGRAPQVLQGKRVVELELNALVAGSKYRGEFEERIKTVLDEIIAHQDELIIFIDEFHMVIGTGQGSGEGGLDVANVLKPPLARGELHLIGATTLNEYQKHIEKDAALERRFQPVLVPEPTVEQTIEILRGLRDKYEAHHKVKITDEAIVAAAEMSDRYISNRFLPDKAIDLIDQAASRVRIRLDTYSQEMEELDEQIVRVRREREYATNHKDFAKSKEHDKHLKKLEGQKEASNQQWRKQRGASSQEVQVAHIAQIISSITGIPVNELTQEEKEKLLKMEERLHERVIGQDEAVAAVSDAIRMARLGLTEGNRPIASFLFLGPTGVGKTELAKALAWTIFGDEDALVRIDMSEYMERHTTARLVGSPPGYVGYEEGGQLTERIRRQPYSVLLLDEIEKAHPDVHNILLQVLDDGRLTDGKGRVVDFTNTIIIATSNVGATIIQDNLAAKKTDKKNYEELKMQLLEVLRMHFRPEFINRLDEIILFQSLTKGQIKEIVKLQLERVRRTAHGQGIGLEFDASLVGHLADIGYQPEYGARELKRRIRTEVEQKLAREILGETITEGDQIKGAYSQSKGVHFEKVKDK